MVEILLSNTSIRLVNATPAQLRSLQERQAELLSLTDQVSHLQSAIGSLYSDPKHNLGLHLRKSEQEERVRRLREDGVTERKQLKYKREQLEARTLELRQRRERLKRAWYTLNAEQQKRASTASTIDQLRAKLSQVELSLHERHAKLLRALEEVYPIELIDASALLYSIAGVPLPNAVASCPASELESQDKMMEEIVKAHNIKADQGDHTDGSKLRTYHSLDDDTISTSLGLVAQLVTLLSSYLATPVHYPMATPGSRAVVLDTISIMNGPRAFPLYAKGVEHYRYEYAAFLVNKNIEQLMNVNNVTVLDIRHTLPNLKNLIVTVSAAPPASQNTRKRHIGKHEIALQSKTQTQSKLGMGQPTAPPVPVPDSLVTTRVLGPAQPAPPQTTASTFGRAFSFFGSK